MSEKNLKIIERLRELIPQLDENEKLLVCTYAQGMASCSEAVRRRKEKEGADENERTEKNSKER
jgi:hypothetical protein